MLWRGAQLLFKGFDIRGVLRRPEITISSLSEFGFEVSADPDICDSVEVGVKYSGYIKRQTELIDPDEAIRRNDFMF